MYHVLSTKYSKLITINTVDWLVLVISEIIRNQKKNITSFSGPHTLVCARANIGCNAFNIVRTPQKCSILYYPIPLLGSNAFEWDS